MNDDVRASVEAAAALARARLDTWAQVVIGVAAEATDTADALADPRLEAAADAFHQALGSFEEATLVALGFVREEPGRSLPAGAGGTGRTQVDDFYLHLVVGTDPDGDEWDESTGADRDRATGASGPNGPGGADRLDAVMDVLDNASEQVVELLEAAGFVVPVFGTSRGDPGPDFLLDGDSDEEDE